MDKFIVIACLALVVVVFGLIGAVTFGATVAPADSHNTADNALTTARQFVNAENTFKFDGMTETLNVKMNKTVSSGVFEIVAEFTSRHAGFGDRADKMVAEVLTTHTAVITVENGAVASAVMDGEWDMIGQKTIDTQTPPSTMPRLDPTVSTPVTTPDGAQL
ncbi:MAG TPA: hypothetical protein VGJ92_05995 [Methanocella sp.]|jgi:hypothetical protein